jgi:NADH:ubiquinone oxidoreductase subunit C
MTFSILNTYDKNNNIIAYNPATTNNISENINIDELVPTQLTYIITNRHDLRPISAFLKLHSLSKMTNAIDITVVDHINAELRFNVNYQFQSTVTNSRYVLSTWISESTPLLSLQSIYPAFNWAEREAWDMYGVFFAKHPDLRRILTDYGFIGFPLRKDFPLSGFREIQYEELAKQVEYSNAELTQSYRLLSFANPWIK